MLNALIHSMKEFPLFEELVYSLPLARVCSVIDDVVLLNPFPGPEQPYLCDTLQCVTYIIISMFSNT